MLRAAAAGGGGEPRGPFKEDWNPLLYGTDVARAASEHKSTPALSVIVFVSSDAPVDRGRLTDVLERGADHGVHAVFVSPTVESLPAVCRSYVDVTAGLEDAQVGLVRNGENYEHVRVEGVSNAVHGDAGATPRSGGGCEHRGARLVRHPDVGDVPAAGRPRHRGGSSGRHRALAAEQHHRRPIVGSAAAPEEGGHASGDHRTGTEQRDGPRPAHAGAARPRRRHHRSGQVGVPPGVGARHGSGAQSRPRDVPVRRLQGRFRVRGLRRAAALRGARDRPQPAPGAPRADEPASRTAEPGASAQPQEGEGPARTREASGSGVPAGPRPRDRRVRRAGIRDAGVRRRRRGHRPARPFARHPPDHGHPAPRGRHQRQSAREHESAHRAAHGGRVRLARRGRRRDRGDLPGDGPRPGDRQDRSRATRAVPVRLCGRLDHRG